MTMLYFFMRDLFGCVLLSQACDNDESVRSIWCRLESVDTFFMLDKKEMTCCFTGHRILPKGKKANF